MFCKRLSFVERPFAKMEAIFIFCKVRFSLKASKKTASDFHILQSWVSLKESLKKT
jgi:hypothetical protein